MAPKKVKKATSDNTESKQYIDRIFAYVDHHDFHEKLIQIVGECFKQGHHNPWLYIAEKAAEQGGVSWDDFKTVGIIDELKRQNSNHVAFREHMKKKFGDKAVMDCIKAANANLTQVQSSVSSLLSCATDEPVPKSQKSVSSSKQTEVKEIPKQNKVTKDIKDNKMKAPAVIQLSELSEEDQTDSHVKEIDQSEHHALDPIQAPSDDESNDETNESITEDPKLLKDPKVVVGKKDIEKANAAAKLQESMNEPSSSVSKTIQKPVAKAPNVEADDKLPKLKLTFKPLKVSTPSAKKVDPEKVPSVSSIPKLVLQKSKLSIPSSSNVDAEKVTAEAQKNIKKDSESKKDEKVSAQLEKAKEVSKPPKVVSQSAKNNPFARKPKVKPIPEKSQAEEPEKVQEKIQVVKPVDSPQIPEDTKMEVDEIVKDEVKSVPVEDHINELQSNMEVDKELVIAESANESENDTPKVSEKDVESDDILKSIFTRMESIHEEISSEVPNDAITTILTDLPDSEEISAIRFDDLLAETPQKAQSTPLKAPVETKMPLSGGKNFAMIMQHFNPKILKKELEEAKDVMCDKLEDAKDTDLPNIEISGKVEEVEAAEETDLPTESPEIAAKVEEVEIEVAEKKQITPVKVPMHQLPSDDFEPDYEYDD